jgi:membrane-bound lytic murein transglycosylase D
MHQQKRREVFRSTESERGREPGSASRSTLPWPVSGAFAALALAALSLPLLANSRNQALPAGPPYPGLELATEALLETRLPVQVNGEVERWIHRFLNQNREAFEGYLVREGLYGGLIQDRLRDRGMPEELLYLAMIESGFMASATSPVSASGVWQFMGATARAYGLRMDYWVDERRDPVRATDAALDYLDELYEMFDSWYLAAAAYNAGPGAVQRALRRGGSGLDRDVDLYWQVSQHLPRETREYVPKILAATLLAQQADHFGIDVEKSLPYLFDQVLVPGGTSLSRVAQALGVQSSLIRELNPHLIRGVTPPGGSTLVRVPEGDSHRLVASLLGAAGGAGRAD